MPLVTGASWNPDFDELPCDLCPLRARCRIERLACEAFEVYLAHGGRRWRSAAREPSAEIYARVFKDGTQLAA
jgi:hypothetical protein